MVVAGRQRHRLEDGLGDEGERALGADQQAAEDLQRLVGVEEGAEPVAGRVLDLELAADALAQLGVGADLVADRRQARRPAPARPRRSVSAAPGAAVSIVVPEGRTKVSERTVE